MRERSTRTSADLNTFYKTLATTYGTSNASLMPAQTVFNFDQPTRVLPALHEGMLPVTTAGTPHAIHHRFRCCRSIFSNKALPSSCLPTATLTALHYIQLHQSPRMLLSSYSLCHNCDSSFEPSHITGTPFYCAPLHLFNANPRVNTGISSHTTIHLGSGTYANHQHCSAAAATHRGMSTTA